MALEGGQGNPVLVGRLRRLTIVPAWRASPECLQSGDESEPTEFRFGSIV